jgi:hypothetical protein
LAPVSQPTLTRADATTSNVLAYAQQSSHDFLVPLISSNERGNKGKAGLAARKFEPIESVVSNRDGAEAEGD